MVLCIIMFLSQHGVMNVDVLRDWRMDRDRTEDVHEGAYFLSTCVTNPSILLHSTISHWLMERRRAPPVARVHSTPPICSRVQLMCCSSFPSPRLHLPPLFTLHLLSDTYSIWFNNSLPLSFRTSSLNIHPPLFSHTFSSLLVL